jgi:F-type H+-transporting ATPase subunit delta
MAENVTLARPYAEAVFGLARDAGALDAWAEALDRLAVVAQDADARNCITNPELSVAQVTQLLIGSAGVALSPEQQNFVSVLVENGRAELLPEISDLYRSLKNQQEGTQDAVVSSAFPMEQSALARLVGDLEGRFGKLNVTVRVEPDLIGGVRIAIGDEVIDASVRGKLAAMAAALQN